MTAPTLAPEVHPRFDRAELHELIAPRDPLWTPRELRELTSTVTADFQDRLVEVVRFASPQRWWTRLALTDEVELWLLSWLPGQGTAPHDHGGAAGAFTVLFGEVAETYRYPSGPIREHRHPVGTSIGFGQGRAHQVRNLGQVKAATVHAYSPPLVPTREYSTLREVPDEIPALPLPRFAR
ncbi:putative metal-dependent enzyme (double-stranded beta helix superfamily) [Actinokineospora baliensis]|uniref:cysteine dioxygenase n=1 Tax=Actinokineospora baliensis TaxID=547056 RepID=UPI001958527C|nr:cysteine dioxygenase family protein [Actinokineospora baliensis]MBM7772694.1 putative metal-dependent enzyme (double-stranded beta helix superfamily) [Actinokineospora baliensis]